jgi:[protein-PII] uridylyltransferase
LDVIEGESVDGEDLPEWVKQIKAVVTEMVPVELRDAELDKFLAGADSRYFLDYYPGIIAEHFVDYRKYLASRSRNEMEDGDLIARKTDHRKPGFSSITLVVKDKPGLFYHIAGTLTASRINILGAWSHSVNEIAIGTFHVNDIPEGPLDDPDRWDRFQDDFKKVLNGAANVDDLIEVRRKARRYGAGGYTPRFPLKVELDNAASDRALIIEVNAHDRPGLLYDITRKLSALNLDIVLAKITTEVDQAADIFYVVDTGGGKIVDRDRLDVIKSSLTEHLSAMEAEYATDQKDGVIVF